jgi:hypothetical protein
MGRERKPKIYFEVPQTARQPLSSPAPATASRDVATPGSDSSLIEAIGVSARVFKIIHRVPKIFKTGGLIQPLDDLGGPITFTDSKFSHPSRPGAMVVRGINLSVGKI